MNLVQQLAQYQNAPLQTLEAAKRGADPAVSPWVASAILSDRIEKQKRMQNALGAAQGPMPTVAEQQDQELSGIMALQAPQMEAPEAEPETAAEGGLMSARVDPSMYEYCGGGIIAFDGGGQAPDTSDADDMSQPAKDTPYLEQLANVLGLVPEALKALVSAPGHGMNKETRREERPAPRAPSQADLAAAHTRAVQDGNAATSPRMAPPPAPAARPAAPAAPGIMGLGSVQKAVTSAPEWAAMEKSRTAQFEAPDMAQSAEDVAAEREAHLKAQGITKKPWELASEQTAELRRLLGEEDAARKQDRAENERDERYRTFVANLGSGSFGQSSQGGLRANLKREEDLRAEEQRIKELRYNQNVKLNEIDAKAQELRYNEATGDVAAAQKNRQELAKLKNEFAKHQDTLAQQMSTLRQNAASHDLQAQAQLAAAGMRQGASQALTPKQIADIRDKANDNINNKVKAGGVQMQMALKRDPQLFERMVQQETDRLLAQLGGGAGAGPVQSQYGPPPQGAVRLKK